MEHIQVPLAYHCKAPLSLLDKDAPEQIKRYREQKMGLQTSNLGESGGFVRLNPGAPAPELQYHFGPDCSFVTVLRRQRGMALPFWWDWWAR